MSLTFVPTPLGNLRDITLRALDVLRACDLLVAEDTRVARRLLSALDLPGKEIWSYREQNAAGATSAILERARVESVAVVSDAGMPGISDPGTALVAAARDAGVEIEVLPGPVAFVCALVLSGFRIDRLAFGGFVPRANGDRERVLRDVLTGQTTTAFYEAPGRLLATLRAIEAIDATVNVFVARELTKKFEQHAFGTAAAVAREFETPVRGEIVVVLQPGADLPRGSLEVATEANVDDAIDEALRSGEAIAAIAKELAKRGFGRRADIYRRASARKDRP